MSATFSPVFERVIDGREVLCHEESIFDVQVCNRNVALLLTELGLEADYCGAVEARTMRAAVAVRQALGTTIPAGMPTIGGDSWVEVGVPADYVPRQLERLRELAEFCEREGALVGWA